MEPLVEQFIEEVLKVCIKREEKGFDVENKGAVDHNYVFAVARQDAEH